MFEILKSTTRGRVRNTNQILLARINSFEITTYGCVFLDPFFPL